MTAQPQRAVLVVEDEWLLADMVEQQLIDLGHSVVGPAPSVALALELIARVHVDCAVLDVNLGGEKSFPIAEALIAARIPFLFMTGYVSKDLPGHFSEVPIVHKPIEPIAFEQQLRLLSAAAVANR